ncbi:UPF0158 family protein [Spirosoma endbachense]|uniref:Uncharacterized protein n=1 Tax=Spirosoma endbachense TaxID=2666025 RepID=A0A6P1VT56_9BACT|nr:UPF0158 family protein [Spirosoma endbachense]QHV94566.1 hypothetical protein GJR95_05840 [Spirosoma endbachense]
MIQMDDSQVKEIVEQQQIGMLCYVHRQTGQLITFPNPEQFSDLESEEWQDQIDQVQSFPDHYWKVAIMTSREEFALMEQFARYEAAEPLQSRLLTILGQSKPFRHFKEAVDRSGSQRLVWFSFRDKQKISWLKQQLTLAD